MTTVLIALVTLFNTISSFPLFELSFGFKEGTITFFILWSLVAVLLGSTHHFGNKLIKGRRFIGTSLIAYGLWFTFSPNQVTSLPFFKYITLSIFFLYTAVSSALGINLMSKKNLKFSYPNYHLILSLLTPLSFFFAYQLGYNWSLITAGLFVNLITIRDFKIPKWYINKVNPTVLVLSIASGVFANSFLEVFSNLFHDQVKLLPYYYFSVFLFLGVAPRLLQNLEKNKEHFQRSTIICFILTYSILGISFYFSNSNEFFKSSIYQYIVLFLFFIPYFKFAQIIPLYNEGESNNIFVSSTIGNIVGFILYALLLNNSSLLTQLFAIASLIILSRLSKRPIIIPLALLLTSVPLKDNYYIEHSLQKVAIQTKRKKQEFFLHPFLTKKHKGNTLTFWTRNHPEDLGLPSIVYSLNGYNSIFSNTNGLPSRQNTEKSLFTLQAAQDVLKRKGRPLNVLVIGLGNLYISSLLQKRIPLQLTIADNFAPLLEPELFSFIRQYNGLSLNNVTTYLEDGYKLASKSELKQKFDLIINNVTSENYLASRKLYTQEYIDALKRLLLPDGVLISDITHNAFLDCAVTSHFKENQLFEGKYGYYGLHQKVKEFSLSPQCSTGSFSVKNLLKIPLTKNNLEYRYKDIYKPQINFYLYANETNEYWSRLKGFFLLQNNFPELNLQENIYSTRELTKTAFVKDYNHKRSPYLWGLQSSRRNNEVSSRLKTKEKSPVLVSDAIVSKKLNRLFNAINLFPSSRQMLLSKNIPKGPRTILYNKSLYYLEELKNELLKVKGTTLMEFERKDRNNFYSNLGSIPKDHVVIILDEGVEYLKSLPTLPNKKYIIYGSVNSLSWNWENLKNSVQVIYYSPLLDLGDNCKFANQYLSVFNEPPSLHAGYVYGTGEYLYGLLRNEKPIEQSTQTILGKVKINDIGQRVIEEQITVVIDKNGRGKVNGASLCKETP